jgi:hypothetical protein
LVSVSWSPALPGYRSSASALSFKTCLTVDALLIAATLSQIVCARQERLA